MSSETSTDTSTFRPWQLFVLAGLLASTLAVVLVRPGDPVVLILMVAAIGSAAGVGLALYRTLSPLTVPGLKERTQIIGGRTRAALEREKTLILRAIKELEFDRAMGKVSDEDFREMSRRLRSRAVALMKQLDVETPGYREVIERELAQRLGVEPGDEDLGEEDGSVDRLRLTCGGCGTQNEGDARFCKSCGSALEPASGS